MIFLRLSERNENIHLSTLQKDVITKFKKDRNQRPMNLFIDY